MSELLSGIAPWPTRLLGELSEKTTVGFVGSMSHLFVPNGVPLLRGGNIRSGRLDLADLKFISDKTHQKWSKSSLKPGDLVMVRVGYPGTTSVVPEELGPANAASLVIVRPRKSELEPRFVAYFLNSPLGMAQLQRQLVGGAQQVFNTTLANRLEIPVPEIVEQQRLVNVLGDVDQLLDSLERLIAKKRELGQGLMQALLTGATRLTGFERPWSVRRIHEVLAPRSELNISGDSLEVLSCTKHEGFVRSLDYFKNQVFSRDLSSYRVIRRGDIGYPANHIEEGSIGVQELYDRAVVSPIYVVMYPIGGNDSFFLQRQMKLESFRQRSARVMNASVDRRGSLRWKEFSQIEVQVPDLDEQHAIARVLRDADDEISALQRRLESAQAIKQGMMQELLTGRTRLTEEFAA